MRDQVPRVVVFDLGKVFLDFDFSKSAIRIAREAEATPEEIIKIISNHPAMIAYETGKISTMEFFDAMRSAIGFKGTSDAFFEYFTDVFTPIQEMIDFNDRLRSRGVKTYILSNTNEVTVNFIRKTYPFFGRFDGYVFSHEYGAMKPDERIYRAAERLTGCRGPEIFYVDDLPANVEGARKCGWQAFLHESPDKTIAIAKQVGLIP